MAMAMAMAVFLGGRLTLSDQDGFQCQVRYVVGLRYFSMAKGAKEVRDSMGSCMEYAVEYRVYSIVVCDCDVCDVVVFSDCTIKYAIK
jgi:hypothetical protein